MRRPRKLVTREIILDAARHVMASGNFRPSLQEIADRDGFSVRAIYLHFSTIGELYLAAIDDDSTSHAIAAAVLSQPNERALARVVVTGRIET